MGANDGQTITLIVDIRYFNFQLLGISWSFIFTYL